MEGQGPLRPFERKTIAPDTKVVVAKPESLETTNEPAVEASTMRTDYTVMPKVPPGPDPFMDATFYVIGSLSPSLHSSMFRTRAY